MKRTLQRNKRSRAKVHGFFARIATIAGQNVLKRRRLRGRKQVTVQSRRA